VTAIARSLAAALVLVLLTCFGATSASALDGLERCRLGVTRANVWAAVCVGRELSTSLRESVSKDGGIPESVDCEAKLSARYRRLGRLAGPEIQACGATQAHATTLIGELRETLDFVEDLSVGRFEVLASGLRSPRGLSCAPAGDDALVYVAEAGSGGPVESESYIAADGRPAFLGTTGAVGRLDEDLRYERVIDGLASSAAADASGGFLDANGPTDVAFTEAGQMRIAMGLGSNADVRDGLISIGAEQLGTVLDDRGEILADLAAFERDRNVDGRQVPAGCGTGVFVDDLTSNPFRLRGGASVQLVDAGANAVLEIDAKGGIEVVAADFPDQLQTMPDLSFAFPGGQTACPPDGPGLPPAGPLPAQSVPTSLSCPSDATDAGCLVGELTGLPFAQGSARVYDISTAAEEYPVVRGGFTTIVDLAHGADGDLFVLEYARQGLAGIFGIAPPLGGLSRVSGGITQSLDGGRLTAPSGVAVCGEYVYVTDRTRTAGEGRLLRMRLD